MEKTVTLKSKRELGAATARRWGPGVYIKGVSQIMSFDKKDELDPAKALVTCGINIYEVRSGDWVIDWDTGKRAVCDDAIFDKYFETISP